MREKGSEEKKVVFFKQVFRLARGKSLVAAFSSLFSRKSFRESKKKTSAFLFFFSHTRCRSPPSRRRPGPLYRWRLCRQGMTGITPPRGSSPACSEGQFFSSSFDLQSDTCSTSFDFLPFPLSLSVSAIFEMDKTTSLTP